MKRRVESVISSLDEIVSPLLSRYPLSPVFLNPRLDQQLTPFVEVFTLQVSEESETRRFPNRLSDHSCGFEGYRSNLFEQKS